jgi:hypothetical protein
VVAICCMLGQVMPTSRNVTRCHVCAVHLVPCELCCLNGGCDLFGRRPVPASGWLIVPPTYKTIKSNSLKPSYPSHLPSLQLPVRPGEASQPLAPWVSRFQFDPATRKACITFVSNSSDTIFYQVPCRAFHHNVLQY